nr:odorant receptor [Semanotus bifasciatus]
MVFPRNDHFKVTMYANALLGVWPFIFENNRMMKRLYNIYANFTFIYYLLFIVSAYVELFVLLLADEKRVQEIVGNLCITLLYSITIMRVYAIKTKNVKDLIREVINVEDVIYKCEDEAVIDIYKECVHDSHISNYIFLANISVETLFYFLHPLYLGEMVRFDKATNQTKIVRGLPLSSWFPFDKQEHYTLSYLWQIFDGTVGASYVMYTDIFTFSLIIFPIGQIKVLMHILRNFNTYVQKTQDRYGYDRDEASFLTMRECMIKHKDVIRYINAYNDTMKNIMVLDFLQSSLQLASIVVQLFVSEVRLFNVIFHGEFAFCMVIRLLVYYWYANEIMIQSSEVSLAVWESDWYEEPQNVKQMMLIMIMRSNKPLVLDIGPFSTMTLNAFLGILKATYSYMMIIYN